MATELGLNRTLEKGLDMLLQFTEERPVMSVKDIIAELDLPRSTAYRLLETLKNKNLIQECGPGQYCLGLSILQLAKVATVGMDLVNLALPVMRELTEKTDETVILSGFINDQAICIDRIESSQPLKLTFERGRVQSIHAGASAKVLLAFFNEEKQLSIIEELSEKGLITNQDDYIEDLLAIKNQGYSISTGEIDAGAWAVAAPIFGSSGEILAGITVAGPKFRIDQEKENEIIETLLFHTSELNQKIKLMGINTL